MGTDLHAVQGRRYDAIVVGSGISGGWAAKELTEAGLRTLVLEAGGPIDPARDYVEHLAPHQVRFRGYGDRERLAKEQPIQRVQATAAPLTLTGQLNFVPRRRRS